MPASNLLSTTLKQEVGKIVATVANHELDITCKIHSGPEVKEFEFMIRPAKVMLVQDYIDYYTDHLYAVIYMNPTYLHKLITHYQDLKCRLIIRKTDPVLPEKGDIILDRDYLVFLPKIQELTQSYSVADLESNLRLGDTLIPVDFELIDPELYFIRRKQFQFMATDVTMEDIIKFVTQQFGIRKLHLVPPDNEKRYTNFVIPKMLSLDSIFTWLQKRPGLGVYTQGCNYYYSNDVLYVYPSYDCDPVNGITSHVYLVGEGNYMGMANNHRVDETNGYHILTSVRPAFQPIAIAGYENDIDGRVLCRTEKMVEYWHKVNPEKNIVVPSNNVVLLSKFSNLGIVNSTESSTAKVILTNNNSFDRVSDVSAIFRNRMAFEWDKADIFSLKPSFPMKIHYDKIVDNVTESNNIQAVVVDAVVEKIIYELSISGRNDPPKFICNALIQVATEVSP